MFSVVVKIGVVCGEGTSPSGWYGGRMPSGREHVVDTTAINSIDGRYFQSKATWAPHVGPSSSYLREATLSDL